MTHVSSSITQKKLGRPRNHELRSRVLKIARDMAVQQGYRQVSLQTIATVAHVGRPTLYRWWPNKVALYLDVIKEEFEDRRPMIDIDSPDGFKRYITATCDIGSGPFGSLCIEVFIDMSDHVDEHSEMYHIYIVDSRERIRTLLAAFARQQGQKFVVSIDVITDMIIGAMWYRLIHKHLPLNSSVAEDIYQATKKMLV